MVASVTMPTLVDPVARPHQVIGAQPALAFADAAMPALILGPLVDIHTIVQAKPDGVGPMSDRFCQAKLTLQKQSAPAGIHYPASLDRAVSLSTVQMYLVELLLGKQLNALYFGIIPEG